MIELHKIRGLRKAKGMSQMELAVLCDVSLDSIGRLERGKTKKIGKLFKKALERALL